MYGWRGHLAAAYPRGLRKYVRLQISPQGHIKCKGDAKNKSSTIRPLCEEPHREFIWLLSLVTSVK